MSDPEGHIRTMADKRPKPPTDEAMKATALSEWEGEGGAPSDPIEGFDFIDYQDGRLTIQVDQRAASARYRSRPRSCALIGRTLDQQRLRPQQWPAPDRCRELHRASCSSRWIGARS